MLNAERKIVPLDAMRGIAAIVVAVGHFFYAFAPRVHGVQFDGKVGLFGTPFFAIFNGTAAVVFFFVLSGFVLSTKALRNATPSTLARSAIKRWPRLLGPVLLVNLLSATMAITGLYTNIPASELTGSDLLSAFEFHQLGHGPSFIDAAFEATIQTFLTGSAFYNPVLWTMFYEFFGSFLVFGVAFVLLLMRPAPLQVGGLTAAWAISFYVSPLFSCFVIGVALAAFHSRSTGFAIPRWAIGPSLAIVFLIWGYDRPVGYYQAFDFKFSDSIETRTFVYTVAAVILMGLGLWSLQLRKLLSSSFGERLGQLSFPLYLTHFPVICSLGSWVYINLSRHAPPSLVLCATFAVCSVATIAISAAVASLDRLLTRRLDALVNSLPLTSRMPRTSAQ